MTDKQVQIFEQKASEYRAALSICPDARLLEIFPIISTLDWICEQYDMQRSRLSIVDLMAGDGFLSKALRDAGYRNIYAIEACLAMSHNSKNFSKITLHNVPSLDEAIERIKNIKPQVVVSLASFHHLVIENENGGGVNRARSAEYQAEIISRCLSKLRQPGLFILCDLIEPDMRVEKAIDLPFISEERLCGVLLRLQRKRRATMLNKPIGEIEATFSDKSSYGLALQWFRSYVDPKTVLGHIDAAMGSELYENLKKRYSIVVGRFSCPWLFPSESERKDFIYRKFGFGIGKHPNSPEEILREADRSKHLGRLGEFISFKWDLGLMVCGKDFNPYAQLPSYKHLNILLLGVISAFVSLGSLSWLGIYVFLSNQTLALSALSWGLATLIALLRPASPSITR